MKYKHLSLLRIDKCDIRITQITIFSLCVKYILSYMMKVMYAQLFVKETSTSTLSGVQN